MYLVKQGTVKIQKYINIDKQGIQPTNVKQWQMELTSELYLHTVQKCSTGHIFGETEMVYGLRRGCNALVTRDCEVFYLGRDGFFDTFEE